MGRAGRVSADGSRSRTLLYVLHNAQVLKEQALALPKSQSLSHAGPWKQHQGYVCVRKEPVQEQEYLPETSAQDSLCGRLLQFQPIVWAVLLQYL